MTRDSQASPFDAEGNLVASNEPVMQRVLTLARGVAQTPTTVLLTGESGTGKEVLARLIHTTSPRRSGPFVAINCAAIPATLMESELFGYEKGAFSGAADARRGRFEQAQRGTLLLDEISELPLELQAKLLRVIQERRVVRVGGSRTIELDVRIIATSNRDLADMVRRGTFRQDLYYRINVFPVTLPALRDRSSDIGALSHAILSRLTARMSRTPLRLSEDALHRLATHPFPGNVRELQNVLERAVVLTQSGSITSQDLVFDGQPVTRLPVPQSVTPNGFKGQTLAEIEREVILNTLQRLSGNRTRTSEVLGISIRTLRNRLREYRGAGYHVVSHAA